MADPFLEMIDGCRSPDAVFTARYGETQKIQQPQYWPDGVSREIKFRTSSAKLGRKDGRMSPDEVVASFRLIEGDILRLRHRAEICTCSRFEFAGDSRNELAPGIPAFGPRVRFGELFPFFQALHWRAAAELELGRVAEAYIDTEVLMRMADATNSQSTVLGALLGRAMCDQVTQLLWQGIVSGSWTTDEITGFRNFFGPEDFWKAIVTGISAERVLTIECWSSPSGFLAVMGSRFDRGWTHFLNSLGPGFAYQHSLRSENSLNGALACIDPVHRRFNLPQAEHLLARDLGWRGRLESILAFGSTQQANLLAVMIGKAGQPGRSEVGSVIAALELFRIAQHRYPAKLDELVPVYLSRIPTSVLTGEQPAYTRIDPDHFRLSAFPSVDLRSVFPNDSAPGPVWVWLSPEHRGR
jgi:hypothetical protein